MNIEDTYVTAAGAVSRWHNAKHLGQDIGDLVTSVTDALYQTFAKELQDMAYSTYEDNIEVSLNKDMIDRWHSNTNKDWS